MLPPVLEVYVVWHPGDVAGERIASTLLEHFRGTAFSGLIGGAIDVFVRSVSVSGSPADPPPLIPVLDPPPYDLAVARYTAVVVVGGSELAVAVEEPGPWRDYIEQIAAARNADPKKIGMFPVKVAFLSHEQAVENNDRHPVQLRGRDLPLAPGPTGVQVGANR